MRLLFYGELNDFLPQPRRNIEFQCAAGITDNLNHVIQSQGVPHTEIARVTVNGETRALSDRPSENDHVQVFPHAIPFSLDDPRFVVDGHLGRLASYLRMIGFDTWYDRDARDPLLSAVAALERRVVLTRDVGLLMRREIEQGYWVRSPDPRAQLREVCRRFGLFSQFAPFSRCMDCNGFLCSVAKDEIADLLPPRIRDTKNEFNRCVGCGKVFWRGSHYARMAGWIEELKDGS
jgi:uncharacterized protein with PIN domain